MLVERSEMAVTNKVQTDRGFRLVQNGVVLSEVLSQPGATHSVFDVLAIGAALISEGEQCGVLGFAAGGLLAPLRKYGSELSVNGVDLEEEGYRQFSEACGSWVGKVEFDHGDAVQWLEDSGLVFDVIIEDLSAPMDDDVFKPDISLKVLPELIRRRLSENQAVVVNLLRHPKQKWNDLLRAVGHEGESGVLVSFDDYWNKILMVSRSMGGARAFGKQLRDGLRQIDSNLADGIFVQGWRYPSEND